eukprot:scaffold56233_cov76-Attheya_sp.AAC.1
MHPKALSRKASILSWRFAPESTNLLDNHPPSLTQLSLPPLYINSLASKSPPPLKFPLCSHPVLPLTAPPTTSTTKGAYHHTPPNHL